MSERFFDVKKKKKRTGNKRPVVRSRLEPDELEYFTRVETMLQENQFESDEERSMFIGNVFQSVDTKEYKLCMDRVGSRVLEKLLAASNSFQIRLFIDRLQEKYGELCCDKFGSHVMQTIFRLSLPIIHKEMVEGVKNPEESADMYSMQELFGFLFEELSVGWVDLMYNDYGSHVLRVILGLLCGRVIDESIVRSKVSIGFTKFAKTNKEEDKKVYDVPESFEDVLFKLTDTIVKRGDIGAAAAHVTAGPVLQTLLKIMKEHNPDVCQRIISKLLKLSKHKVTGLWSLEEKDYISDSFFYDNYGSRTMETVLETVNEDIFRLLYLEIFRNKLVELSLDQFANYVVQHLLKTAKDEIMKQQILDEMIEKLEEILGSGNFGVVAAMLLTCSSMSEDTQKKMARALLKSFHINESSKNTLCVPTISRLLTLEVYEGEGGALRETTPYGASILENLFKFEINAITPFIQSMTAMSKENLIDFCCDVHGCRIFEGFAASKLEFSKKKKFFKKMSAFYAKLAMDKYGSRSLDAIWNNSEISFKETVATTLLESETLLKDNLYGKIVVRNCNLDYFKRKKGDWVETQESNQRKKDMFKDILEDVNDEPMKDTLVETRKAKKDKNSKRVKEVIADPFSIPKNEIDDLFTAKKKNRRNVLGQTSDKPSTDNDTKNGKDDNDVVPAVDADDKKNSKKKSKKSKKLSKEQNEDLDDLKQMIANTKRKKKTKASSKEERKEQKKSAKEKQSKKKRSKHDRNVEDEHEDDDSDGNKRKKKKKFTMS